MIEWMLCAGDQQWSYCTGKSQLEFSTHELCLCLRINIVGASELFASHCNLSACRSYLLFRSAAANKRSNQKKSGFAFRIVCCVWKACQLVYSTSHHAKVRRKHVEIVGRRKQLGGAKQIYFFYRTPEICRLRSPA